MKNLKPNSHRLSFTEAVTRLVCQRYFTDEVLRRWLRRRYRRRYLRRFKDKKGWRNPDPLRDLISEAGKQGIEFTLEHEIPIWGKPYIDGREIAEIPEERISNKFLKSGIYPEVLNCAIFTDWMLNKNAGARLRDYKFVELDRSEFCAALKGSKTGDAQAEEAGAKPARTDEKLREARNELQPPQEEHTHPQQEAPAPEAIPQTDSIMRNADRTEEAKASDKGPVQFSRPKLRREYKKWVAENVKINNVPKREEDLAVMRDRMGVKLPRQAVRDIRKKEAPKFWQRSGPKKK